MKNISIDARLEKCAGFLRFCKMADIGTDHAYLPVFAYQKGMIKSAIACDIGKGPLESAEKTILKYGLSDKIETRLCDGLSGVSPDEADDIVIAGMGGELISKIISDAPWLSSKEKRLILQPMTFEPFLRSFLLENMFEITAEEAVIASGKVYTVICAQYTDKPIKTDELYEYIGKIKGETEEDKKYIIKVISRLEMKLRGLNITGKNEEAKHIKYIISKLNEKVGQKNDKCI